MKKTIYAVAILAALLVAFAVRGSGSSKLFPKFTTKDLDGNVVTNSIFSRNKVTMINFWATWCPPCVKELPDLAYMGKTLAETSGEGALIGVLLDAGDSGAIQRAKNLLDAAEAQFPHLIPSEEMKSVLRSVSAIPTSIFVDSRGNIIGPTIVGSRSARDYMAAMAVALKEARK